MIRAFWDGLTATVQRVAPEGTLRWHVVTWVGHGLLTVLLWAGVFGVTWLVGVLLGWLGLDGSWWAGCATSLRGIACGAGGGFYTIEEFRQRLMDQPATTAPWWDSAFDVAVPWAVGLWLASRGLGGLL